MALEQREQRGGVLPCFACSARPRMAARPHERGGHGPAGRRGSASGPTLRGQHARGLCRGARGGGPGRSQAAALARRQQLVAARDGGAVPAVAGQGGRGDGRRSTQGGQAAPGRTAALREPARRRLATAQRRRSAIHGGAAVVQRRRPRNRAGIGLGRESIARRSSPATQFERREIGRWSLTVRQSFSTEQQWRTRRRR